MPDGAESVAFFTQRGEPRYLKAMYAFARRALAFAFVATYGCSAVRPPAVSEDADRLARAPLHDGDRDGDSRGDTAREAIVREVGASGTRDPNDPRPGPTQREPAAPAVQTPHVASNPASAATRDLGPVGSVTTSPDERPLDDGPALQAKAALLWQAIVDDTPDVAAAFFFPKEAYVHVKAAKNPEGDWRWRLWKHFERDVHVLHAAQGKALAKATFKGLRIPPKRPHWAAPGNEYNRLGYWRAYGAQLTYELRGRERHVPISSIISWKSEWYVVHLTGFR